MRRALAVGACLRAAAALSAAAPAWRLSLDLGREPGTFMPPAWGASGARLALALDVAVEPAAVESPDAAWRVAFGAVPRRVRPLRPNATFVSARGQQTVRVAAGGWAIARGDPAGDVLRLWLDFPGGAAVSRGDVTLTGYPDNERLFLDARCWRGGEALARASAELAPRRAAAARAEAAFEAARAGDRRLEGAGALSTLAGAWDLSRLAVERDDALRALRAAERALEAPPCDAAALPQGGWAAADAPLAIAPGSVVVKRDRAFGRAQFHLLGTWAASPIALESSELDAVDPG